MPTENLQQSAEILIYTRKEGDEPCFELTCTVVARFPLDKRSGYQRQLVWQDKDELRVWKVPYYDRKDSQRTHADLRKPNDLVFGEIGDGEWELRLGVDRVFWGVTESQHLVDEEDIIYETRRPALTASLR